jgi:hypothetical protein
MKSQSSPFSLMANSSPAIIRVTEAEDGGQAIAPGTVAMAAVHNDVHSFNFFFGHWKVHNRRLKQRLTDCQEWEEFDATSDCRPILGGAGNQDEFLSLHWPNFVGMSLRLYDPQSQRWSIYWIDNQSVILQPPVVGQFFGNVGIFEGPDEHAGQAVLVRYLWSNIDTATPRWEQAFSRDQGATWETNWTMDFRRSDVAIGE